VPLPNFPSVVGDSREDEYVFNWAHKQKGIRDVVAVTLGARNTEASAALTQGVIGTYEALSTFDLHPDMHHCTFQMRSFPVVMIRLMSSF
jgi:trehalose-6-phosphatase